jgi:hypothetical protein
VIDLRLYRLAFGPALLAVIATMFSLEGPPAPLEPAAATASFEGGRALAAAREIASIAPTRAPGSDADAEAARIVAEHFDQVRAGSVAERSHEDTVDGEQVELSSVYLTLPGNTPEAIVVLADRAAAEGTGSSSSAAATGVLVELASAVGLAGHERTLILVSTSDASVGAEGVKELLDSLAATNPVEAVLVVFQPGSPERRQPHVIATSTDESSASAQLERTAVRAVFEQTGAETDSPSAFAQLSRLALPSGLGAQAPLIAADVDAVAISAAGERPLLPPLAESEPSVANLDAFGRATQATIGALDAAPGPPEHGPKSYVEVSGNLVPGWALALLGLALILPAALAAVDALARAARRGLRPSRGAIWVARHSLPFLGALGTLYGLAFVGLVPRDPFPFDPGLHPLGWRAAAAAVLVLAATALSAYLLRPHWKSATAPSDAPASTAPLQVPASAIPAAGGLTALACLLIWLENPYLALLVSPAAHVWLLAAGGGGRPRRLLVGLAAIAALVPTGAALASVASALELGAEAPWTFALMIADGQIGLVLVLAASLLAGSLLAATPAASGLQPSPGPEIRGQA